MLDDKKLIKKIKNGDIDAFEDIVTEYEKKIYNIAYRYCRNEQDACDITQEVFIKVYRSIEGFKEESKLSTWIYKITINMCIDFLRKKSGKNVISINSGGSDEGEELQIIDTNNDPSEILERKELKDEIECALNQLTDDHRDVIILRDMGGLSYNEIMDALNIEEGTVKSRIARARRKLRDVLVERGNFSKTFPSKLKDGREI